MTCKCLYGDRVHTQELNLWDPKRKRPLIMAGLNGLYMAGLNGHKLVTMVKL